MLRRLPGPCFVLLFAAANRPTSLPEALWALPRNRQDRQGRTPRPPRVLGFREYRFSAPTPQYLALWRLLGGLGDSRSLRAIRCGPSVSWVGGAPTPPQGNSVRPIKNRSAALAALRPSAMAQT